MTTWPCPPAMACSADSSRSPTWQRPARRPDRGVRVSPLAARSDLRTASANIERLLGYGKVGKVGVHEMFHPYHRAATGFAAIAQIEHQAGIAHGKAPELGGRHTCPAQEFFDVPQQQTTLLL